MSQKRHREETSEQIHTRHKKLKDDHGAAHRVDPQRFMKPNHTFSFASNTTRLQQDPFAMPLPSDDDNYNDNNNKMLTNSRSPSNDDSEFGLMLYELASLHVGNQNPGQPQAQTCPICSQRVSLKAFPDHVHQCLDMMDSGDRNSMKTQVEIDCDFATEYALKHGYVTDYAVSCPICGKQLLFGTGMNEHVNNCVDESEKKQDTMDDDEDDDINVGHKAYNNRDKVKVLNREQMIECASKLMTLQQGSEQFDNMLDMFGALGFNKQNVKSVLDIEKSNSNCNKNKERNGNMEEDVDLFGDNEGAPYSFDDADL